MGPEDCSRLVSDQREGVCHHRVRLAAYHGQSSLMHIRQTLGNVEGSHDPGVMSGARSAQLPDLNVLSGVRSAQLPNLSVPSGARSAKLLDLRLKDEDGIRRTSSLCGVVLLEVEGESSESSVLRFVSSGLVFPRVFHQFTLAGSYPKGSPNS